MSERAAWTQTAYSFTIVVYDLANAAKAGLVNANFTKTLALNDASSAVAVTVTEIDSVNLPGWYKVTYTPNANGHWCCLVTHATYNVRGWQDEIQVYSRSTDDLAFPATTGRSMLVAVDGSVAPDWSNVKSPTTTVGLTGTTIATSQVVASITNLASGAKTDVENAVWEAARSGHNTPGTMGLLGWRVLRDGTCNGGGGGTIVLDAGASSTTDFYKHSSVMMISGTAAGEPPRMITAYNGSTQTATVSPTWALGPTGGDRFIIISQAIAGVDWQSVQNPTATVNLSATNIATNQVIGGLGSSAKTDVENAVWDALPASHSADSSFARTLLIRAGTVQGGGTNNVRLDAGASSTNDFYKYAIVVITAGTLKGQARVISSYTGASQLALVSPSWVGASPISGDTFAILPISALAVDWAQVANPTATENLTGTTMNLSATGIASIAAAILATPGNLLATDASGRVTIGAVAASAAQFIADALLDRAAAIDGATVRQALQWIAATTAGANAPESTKVAPVYFGLDGITRRVSAIVNALGQRATVTRT